MRHETWDSAYGYKLNSRDGEPAKHHHMEYNTADFKETWSKAADTALLGPFNYLANNPGHNIREHLIAAFGAVIKVDSADLAVISHITMLLHNASLLVDDVEDNSLLRRGLPAAHCLFGVPQTINSANYMYFVALQEVLKLKSHVAVSIYTEEMINLHRGQGMDLYWRETLTCPTEDEYIEMVVHKTGGLFRLALRLMLSVSTANTDDFDLSHLADTFGVIYQILDDYLNLQSTELTENKGFCEDLSEGKFSFPLIHSIRANPDNREIINILKQRTHDSSLKKYAVDYMKNETKSFDYCLKRIDEMSQKASKYIDDLSAAGHDTSKLRAILKYFISTSNCEERKYFGEEKS